jgi:small-conductance mechanosensitive channel
MPPVNRDISALEWSDATTFVSDLAAPVIALTAAVIAALVIAAVLRRLLRVSAKRWSLLGSLSDRVKWPLRLLLVSIAVWLTLAITTELPSDGVLERMAYIVVVVSTAFLAIEVTRAVQDGIRSRFSMDDDDNRYARRVHTQVQILGRLTIALIVVIAIAAVLLSFPQMRALGASILASAGLAAIVAGIAAQSALANVFAGLQIALADAIRVDDVVVVEEEYGRIEEITLTYVVVRIWDDRRMILPSTYFTSSPYENWTRTASDLVGTVELDVDWTVPVEGMRQELDRLLGETDLWDGRKAGIQVTDATGGLVQVRALASATSAPILWDLRCYLREGLVAWIQESGAGLPRTRLERAPGTEAATSSGFLPS